MAEGDTTPGGADAKSTFGAFRQTFKALGKFALAERGGQEDSTESVKMVKDVASSAQGEAAPPSWWSASAADVLEKARKRLEAAYEAVPTLEAESTADDVERGEARKSEAPWSGWLQSAKGLQKIVAENADVARKGLGQAAEKAQGMGGDHAKGLASQVSKGLGSFADGVSVVGGSVSEKTKQARQAAAELQEQSKKKLDQAKTASAAATKGAAERARGAAGSIKGGLDKMGQNMGGLTALTMSPAKLMQFVGLLMAGLLLISMSFSFLPLLAIQPQKFALLFAIGSMVLMSSFGALKGWQAFATQTMQREKLPFTVAYVVGLVGTLVSTILLRSYLMTLFFGALQAFALTYFIASYVPGGKAILNFCGKMCTKATACCMRLVRRG